MYNQDYDGRFPFGGWRPNNDGTNEWQNTCAPYIKNKGIYYCPTTADDNENPNDPTEWAWNRNPVSYMYNNMLARDRRPVSDGNVVEPSNCWLLADGHSDWGQVNNGTNCCNGVDWMGRPRTVWLLEDTMFGDDSPLIHGWLSWQGFTWGLPRHNGGANICYVDGHVKWQKVTPSGPPLAVAEGNRIFREPNNRNGWFERTYPHNKVANPLQNDVNWKWEAQ
jgi:prepilin-type processing-associated H-X9-DG protein